jgi:hypothetical protein
MTFLRHSCDTLEILLCISCDTLVTALTINAHRRDRCIGSGGVHHPLQGRLGYALKSSRHNRREGEQTADRANGRQGKQQTERTADSAKSREGKAHLLSNQPSKQTAEHTAEGQRGPLTKGPTRSCTIWALHCRVLISSRYVNKKSAVAIVYM